MSNTWESEKPKNPWVHVKNKLASVSAEFECCIHLTAFQNLDKSTKNYQKFHFWTWKSFATQINSWIIPCLFRTRRGNRKLKKLQKPWRPRTPASGFLCVSCVSLFQAVSVGPEIDPWWASPDVQSRNRWRKNPWNEFVRGRCCFFSVAKKLWWSLTW